MPIPTELKLHKKSNTLDITFDDGVITKLSSEYLRVHSPSAEVKGHGPGQEVLQTGKETVGISNIEPVGNYSIRITFSDGHNTGLYTWDYLYELATQYDVLWPTYLHKLKAAGHKHTSSHDNNVVEKYKP